MAAVSAKTRAVIWARAAGRCQYPGCNTCLIGDLISGNDGGTFGLIAHIVAETAGGPRGDQVRSAQLADDPSNLMLLCHAHHKLIDVEDVSGHSEQLLLDMKAKHEERIRILSGMLPERASQVLRFGARIGSLESPVSFERVRQAMIPERYPADGRSIGIEILGNSSVDGEADFWTTEIKNLRRQFDTLVNARVASREITHLSVFALAPIPLLVELGRLLGDIVPADVYQLHREPCGWGWVEDQRVSAFSITPPSRSAKHVAIALSLSAHVSPDRVTSVLGDDVAIWHVTVPQPNNDMMRSRRDLQHFREIVRRIFGSIKRAGYTSEIHVFPAIPVSAAVEIGRVWMPKADLPLVVYDETRGRGFVPRLQIG